MITTNTKTGSPMPSRLREMATEGSDRLAELAVDGIERSSDVVGKKARVAAEAARRWADDARSDTTEPLDVSGRRWGVGTWLITGAAVLTAAVGVLWAIRWLRERRPATGEEVENASGGGDATRNVATEQDGGQAAAEPHLAAS